MRHQITSEAQVTLASIEVMPFKVAARRHFSGIIGVKIGPIIKT